MLPCLCRIKLFKKFLLQCGQGSTNDVLKPTCVNSVSGTKIEAVAAGLWHTVCICADGRVQAFGGNQFGQLGLGTCAEQPEVHILKLIPCILFKTHLTVATVFAFCSVSSPIFQM